MFNGYSDLLKPYACPAVPTVCWTGVKQAFRPSVTYLLDFRLTPSFVLCIFVCLLCRILWSEVHRARLSHILMSHAAAPWSA